MAAHRNPAALRPRGAGGNRADLQPRTPDTRWADAIAILLAAAEPREDDEALEGEDSEQ
jgi:hypothetical protein